MPLNVPNFTTSKFSFGPGVLYLGAAGTTPTVDVGGITEDGIKVAMMSKKKDIHQGNPKLVCYTFNQEQGMEIELSGIEWNFDSLAYALGAGNTTVSGTEETFAFGGDPLCQTVAIRIVHQMATSGHTMLAYVWQAVSNGDLELTFGHDEHKFPMKWKAQRCTTNWAGATLPYDEQLGLLVEQIA
jgi:hypothetical protein